MSEPTIILAALSVLAHCIAIFWPRKPLQARMDSNGLPILWENDNEKNQNIACIWRDAAEVPAPTIVESTPQRRSA